jgi:hypothetical protein
VLFDLFEPGPNIHERLLIGEIEDYYDSVGALIVSIGNSSVPLLSGGVPNLQLNGRLVNL